MSHVRQILYVGSILYLVHSFFFASAKFVEAGAYVLGAFWQPVRRIYSGMSTVPVHATKKTIIEDHVKIDF